MCTIDCRMVYIYMLKDVVLYTGLSIRGHTTRPHFPMSIRLKTLPTEICYFLEN